MTKRIYDNNLINYMSLFESLTLAKLKDCIINTNSVIFIVHENQAAKAIGKKGTNVRRLEQLLNRKIKIVEFNSDILKFIKNLLYPLKPEIQKKEGAIFIGGDTKTKALLIGRNSQNLNNLISIIKRYFKLVNIKIV
jgi:N utilization substance protein A